MNRDQVGKLLFGRPCRLRLLLWIHAREKPRFFQSEPPRDVILQGDVAKELGRLVQLGMLIEEHPEDSRRIYYERTSSELWKIVEATAEALRGEVG